MSRDWQKDMERVQLGRKMYKTYGAVVEGMDPKESLDEVLIYWLQQYAAEERHNVELCKQILETELREKKLREAITLYISEGMYQDEAEPFFAELLASLYPKEETKPAVLEEGEACN